MEFLKKGFDVFLLPSFEDKSCSRILDLLQLDSLIAENYSSQILTEQRHRQGFFVASVVS